MGSADRCQGNQPDIDRKVGRGGPQRGEKGASGWQRVGSGAVGACRRCCRRLSGPGGRPPPRFNTLATAGLSGLPPTPWGRLYYSTPPSIQSPSRQQRAGGGGGRSRVEASAAQQSRAHAGMGFDRSSLFMARRISRSPSRPGCPTRPWAAVCEGCGPFGAYFGPLNPFGRAGAAVVLVAGLDRTPLAAYPDVDDDGGTFMRTHIHSLGRSIDALTLPSTPNTCTPNRQVISFPSEHPWLPERCVPAAEAPTKAKKSRVKQGGKGPKPNQPHQPPPQF